jgi:ABC-2 type transport system permease protein
MIYDMWTIMCKEFKETLRLRGNLKGGTLGVLIFLIIFGVFLPVQMGRQWLDSPMVLYFWIWVPLFLVSSVVADSFAGERERNTLETLLASRLPDTAILFGKTLSAIGYGWGLTLVSLCLGTVTINLVHGEGYFLFYSPVMSLGILIWSFLGAGLAASAGVLVSLRAHTVRQAQQSLSISIMLLLFVPIFALQALPEETTRRFLNWLDAVSVVEIVLWVTGGLVVLDLLLLAAALSRFKREKLVLD